MTSPDGGRPRDRDNGLSATAYTPLADLDPRLADALLRALRDAGVAAYVAPSGGRRGGYLEVTLPSRPTDRVWVDAAAEPAARAVLAGLADRPEEPAQGADAEWRAIVAMFERGPGLDVPPWPAAEDLNGPGAAVDPPGPARVVRPAGRTPGTGSSGVPAAEPVPPRAEDEEHFVPPPPPPVPQPQPVTRYALAAMLGGIAVLVLPALVGDPVSPALSVLAVLAILGGFATLVARMRDAPPQDSGPDDGAVV